MLIPREDGMTVSTQFEATEGGLVLTNAILLYHTFPKWHAV
ncbi:hypothetical protein PX554_24210 [Sphingomonas sp. H39-1-10]|nr:hypothetical protein [Sphingomonas pollutisoli]MDF0491231.1 hypothetical protein [Sphingomonas pollutisoli]